MREHRTMLGCYEAEITEKKSRFIAYAAPVESEAEAASQLEAVRKKHYTAGHNCYAYRLARDVPLERFSDDGEPSQTAGMPILSVLKGFGLYNALIVVTRYFGGTLLGTGGLVRAYGLAAKECLTNAEFIDKKIYAATRIICDYPAHKRLDSELRKNGFYIKSTDYAADVDVVVLCEPERLAALKTHTDNAASGAALVLDEGMALGYMKDGRIIL